MFEDSSFLPHGICLSWEPSLIWLHVASDGLIGLSYYSIPLALVAFVSRRRDVAYQWMFWLFAVFILACGTTHFFSIWTLWVPDYEIEGAIKAVTALASVLTAVALWVLLPKALALPRPTELRMANQALQREVEERRRAEERYVGFFNNLEEGLFVVEVRPDGSFILDTINPAHARATGLDPSRINGRRVEEFLPPEIAAQVIGRYQACVDADRPIDYEETLDLPVGVRIWHTMLAPVRDNNGRIIQLLGSGRDITERKRLQGELVQTSKLATLGTMAAGMAHEMSQPLNIIRMWAENSRLMMAEGAMPPAELDKVLGLIAEQTQRMGAIIDHMRTFSRRDNANAEAFDPAESVRSAVELVRHQYAIKDIEVTVEVVPGNCAVMGRPLQLEQVVLNLLSNARDAILARREWDGGVVGQIDVGLRFDPMRQMVILTVGDTGGGIPPGVLPHIFDPFFTTKEVGLGSGLGLSISFGIVDAMGGRIEATNRAFSDGAAGACFTITLPAISLFGATKGGRDGVGAACPGG